MSDGGGEGSYEWILDTDEAGIWAGALTKKESTVEGRSRGGSSLCFPRKAGLCLTFDSCWDSVSVGGCRIPSIPGSMSARSGGDCAGEGESATDEADVDINSGCCRPVRKFCIPVRWVGDTGCIEQNCLIEACCDGAVEGEELENDFLALFGGWKKDGSTVSPLSFIPETNFIFWRVRRAEPSDRGEATSRGGGRTDGRIWWEELFRIALGFVSLPKTSSSSSPSSGMTIGLNGEFVGMEGLCHC